MAQGARARHEVDETLAALMRSRSLGVARGTGPLMTEANAEMLRIIARTDADLSPGLLWRSLATPERFDVFVSAARTLVDTGQFSATAELLRPDGTRVPVLVVAALVAEAEQRWLALIVDLSDEQWHGRLADLEAAIVSTLLDDAPIGFALFDRELRFVRINRELAAMNGLSQDEHIGRMVFDVLPSLRETAEAGLRSVLTTGEPLRDIEVVGTTDADPGTEHVWLESFFPVRSNPGAPVRGIATIARDVTRLRALSADLARATDLQREALEQLQHALFPDTLPGLPGWSLGARYISASDQVRLGGDWYDVLVDGDRVVLAMGDVVGHGLPAVGMMAQLRGAGRAFVSEGYGPAEILTRVGRMLLAPGASGMATAVVASLDPATGEVEYASAGHPYALLRTGDRPPKLLDAAQGPMLGVMPHSYVAARATIPPGGALAVFTDGLIERRGQSLSVGFRRLGRTLRGADLSRGAPALVETLLAGSPEAGRRDDTCVLAVVRDRAS